MLAVRTTKSGRRARIGIRNSRRCAQAERISGTIYGTRSSFARQPGETGEARTRRELSARVTNGSKLPIMPRPDKRRAGTRSPKRSVKNGPNRARANRARVIRDRRSLRTQPGPVERARLDSRTGRAREISFTRDRPRRNVPLVGDPRTARA